MRTTSILILSMAVVTSVTACGSDGPTSQTPRVTVASESELGDRLLRADDVAMISGLDGAEVRELDDSEVFANPDTRTPCGIPVSPPPLDGAAAQTVSGPTINVTQYVIPTSDAAAAYLDALQDDDDACGGYTTTSNTGEVQRIGDITRYDTSSDVVDGTAWTNFVEIGGQIVYSGNIVLEADDAMTLLQVRSASAIPAEGVQILTEAATLRLVGSE